MSKRPHVSKPQSAPSSSKKERTHTKGANTGPIAFFIALFVIAVGSIQIISAFHTYAINLSELNSLKKQEAVLAAQKKDLENDIARWDDPAYVTAQARERLDQGGASRGGERRTAEVRCQCEHGNGPIEPALVQ